MFGVRFDFSSRYVCGPALLGHIKASIANQSIKTTNPRERAFDNVLDVYEQLGNNIPLLYEYTRLFTGLPESERCLVYVYQDVLTFHRLAYRLFSLRFKCEIEPRVATAITNTNPRL